MWNLKKFHNYLMRNSLSGGSNLIWFMEATSGNWMDDYPIP